MRERICAVAIAAATLFAAAASGSTDPVLVTEHFAFFSDFETNLNDALITAADNRAQRRDELFHAGADQSCFQGLTEAERVAWDRAVDYYREVVVSGGAGRGSQMLVRLELAAIVGDGQWDEPTEERLIQVTRAVRAAAAMAYRACRWKTQDTSNRRRIDQLRPLLDQHEEAIGRRLSEAFETDWRGLPLRVDIVETVEWSGAHTINLRPPDAAHILMNSTREDYSGNAALETLFHEASHFLTNRSSTLRRLINEAIEELGNPFRGSLLHAVHFYLTGEIVRRRLAESGVSYQLYMFENGVFDQGGFHAAVQPIYSSYLDGDIDLEVACRRLVQRLLDAQPR